MRVAKSHREWPNDGEIRMTAGQLSALLESRVGNAVLHETNIGAVGVRQVQSPQVRVTAHMQQNVRTYGTVTADFHVLTMRAASFTSAHTAKHHLRGKRV